MNARMPEDARFTVSAWGWALGLEAIHQIIYVVLALLDPSEYIGLLREQFEASDFGASDALLKASAIGSIVGSGVLNLVLLGVFGGLLWMAAAQRKHGQSARRIWIIFSVFLVARAVVTVAVPPPPVAGSDALVLVDGCLQILIGVLACIGIVVARRDTTRTWTDKNAPQVPGGQHR